MADQAEQVNQPIPVPPAVAGARREVRRLERSLAATEADLGRHRQWREHRRVADLLSTWAHQIKQGASSAELVEYQPDGSEKLVAVPLDPTESVPEAIRRMHRLASKGERGEQVANTRAERLRGELAAARQRLECLEAGEEPEAVALPAAKPKPPQRVKVPAVPAPDPLERIWKDASSLERSVRPRVYEASGGHALLVGKSAAGNDVLTVRIANGNDWFFHVAESPGSHVILRWRSKEEPGRDVLEDAAQLALHFSKQKDASRGTVTYCQKKHVSKPRGAKPGLVYVSRAKTMAVRRDAGRLDRLLRREEAGG